MNHLSNETIARKTNTSTLVHHHHPLHHHGGGGGGGGGGVSVGGGVVGVSTGTTTVLGYNSHHHHHLSNHHNHHFNHNLNHNPQSSQNHHHHHHLIGSSIPIVGAATNIPNNSGNIILGNEHHQTSTIANSIGQLSSSPNILNRTVNSSRGNNIINNNNNTSTSMTSASTQSTTTTTTSTSSSSTTTTARGRSSSSNVNKKNIQLNKCLNEKRRRGQENLYIEELAALITAGNGFDEMSSLSVKPDKCAILQETVKQIQNINRENQIDDLQESQVSSSRPNLMTSTDISSLLLDALNCFVFTLNPEGQIDYVSENVTKFTKHKPVELVNKSIFDIVHSDDHPRFSSVLLSMAAVNNGLQSNWSSSSTSTSTTTTSATSSHLDPMNSSGALGSNTATTSTATSASSNLMFNSLTATSSEIAHKIFGCGGIFNSAAVTITSTPSTGSAQIFHASFLVKTNVDDDVDDDDMDGVGDQDDEHDDGIDCLNELDDRLELDDENDHPMLDDCESDMLDSVDLASVLHGTESALSSSSSTTTTANATKEAILLKAKRRRLLLMRNERKIVQFKKRKNKLNEFDPFGQYERMQVSTKLLHGNNESIRQQLENQQQSNSSMTMAAVGGSSNSGGNGGGGSGSGNGNQSSSSSSGSTTAASSSSTAHHDSTTSSSCPDEARLMCIARRIPNSEKMIGKIQIEQFTTRMDTSGYVIGIDTSGITCSYKKFLDESLPGQLIFEFAHQNDMPKVRSHLKECFEKGSAVSPVYRFKIGLDKYIDVQTKSKLFKSQPNNITATHCIMCDVNEFKASESLSSSSTEASCSTTVSTVSGSSKTTNLVPSSSSTPIGSTNTTTLAVLNTSDPSTGATLMISTLPRLPIQSQPPAIATKSSIHNPGSSKLVSASGTSSTINVANANSWNHQPPQQQQQQLNATLSSQSTTTSSTVAMATTSTASTSNTSSSSPPLTTTSSSNNNTTNQLNLFSTSPTFDDDLGFDMLNGPWDSFGANGQGDHQPTTTVDGLGSINNGPGPGGGMISTSSSSGGGGLFDFGTSSSSLTNTTTTSSPSLLTPSPSNNNSDDKLRNLLTGGGGLVGGGPLGPTDTGVYIKEEADSGSNTRVGNNLVNSNPNSNSSSDQILRDLLDTDDIHDMGPNPSNDLNEILGVGSMGTTSTTTIITTTSQQSSCSTPIGSASSFVHMLDQTPSAMKSSPMSSGNKLPIGSSSSTMPTTSSNNNNNNNNMLRKLLNDDEICLTGGGGGGSSSQAQQSSSTTTAPTMMRKGSVPSDTLLDNVFKREDPNNNSLECGIKRKSSFDQSLFGNVLQDQLQESKRLATATTTGVGYINTTVSAYGTSINSNAQQQQPQTVHQQSIRQPIQVQQHQPIHHQQQHQQHQLLASANPMLASMLAKTPTSLSEEKIDVNPTIISATPDIKLPRDLEHKLQQPISHPLQPPTSVQSSTHVSQPQIQLQHQPPQPMLNHLGPQQQQQQPPNPQQLSQGQMQHLQLQLQQQKAQQQQHNLGLLGSANVGQQVLATKSTGIPSQQLNIQLRPNQQIQIGNFTQRLPQHQNQMRHQVQLHQTGVDQLQQVLQGGSGNGSILQPQATMAVGQHVAHHQQLQQANAQQQQQQQQVATAVAAAAGSQQQQQQQGGHLLTRILTTTTASTVVPGGVGTTIGVPPNTAGVVGQQQPQQQQQISLQHAQGQAISRARLLALQQQQQQQQQQQLQQQKQVQLANLNVMTQQQSSQLVVAASATNGPSLTVTSNHPPPSLSQSQSSVSFGSTLNNNNNHSNVNNQTNSQMAPTMQQQQSQQQQQTHQQAPPSSLPTQSSSMMSQTSSSSISLLDSEADPALDLILDEVISFQDMNSGLSLNQSSVPTNLNLTLGTTSLNSLLSNVPSANRRPTDELSMSGLSTPDSVLSSTDLLNDKQQAISEIRKQLMCLENIQSSGNNQKSGGLFGGNSSSQITPQSTMFTISGQQPLQQQGPPPNYQTSMTSAQQQQPPPSYPTNFNSQVPNQQTIQPFQINRLPQQNAPNQMMMNVGTRGVRQQLQRPSGPMTPAAYQQLQQQQQQLSGIRMAKGPGGISLQMGPANKAALLEQQKRLLLQQQQQLIPQGPSQAEAYSFTDSSNINELLNSSAPAPNVGIQMKPRSVVSTIGDGTNASVIGTQLSPRYGTVAAPGGMQVPSTVTVSGHPQSPAQSAASQMSPGGPQVPPSLRAPPSFSPAATQQQQQSSAGIYPSPQSNRMSPGHFVGGNGSTSAATASPSPAPPVSPLVASSPQQQQQQQQPVASGTMTPITSWQQQHSPVPNAAVVARLSGQVPSPAQVMSPSPSSSTSAVASVGGGALTQQQVVNTSSSGGGSSGNMISIQQKSNPMLNAQLSAGVQRATFAGGRAIRFQQQPGVSQQQQIRAQQQFQQQMQTDQFGRTNSQQANSQLQMQLVHQQQQLVQQRAQQQQQQQQLGPRMIVTQGGQRMFIQQQPQSQSIQSQVNSFGSMNAQTIKLESDSPFSPVPNSTMFGSNQSQSSQQQQQQQQPSSLIKYETNDQLTMFDQSGNGQSAFSIDISSSSSANSMQPRNVKQEVRNFVNNRNQQHQQQQQQSAQMVQQQQQMQSVATSSSPAQQQVSNSLVSNQSSSSVMDNQIDFLDFEFDMNDFGDMTDTGPGPTGSTPPPMTLGNILGGGNGPSMMSNNQQGGQSLSRTNSMENQKPEQNQQSLLQRLLSEG